MSDKTRSEQSKQLDEVVAEYGECLNRPACNWDKLTKIRDNPAVKRVLRSAQKRAHDNRDCVICGEFQMRLDKLECGCYMCKRCSENPDARHDHIGRKYK